MHLAFDAEGNAEPQPIMLRHDALRRTKFHVMASSAHLEDSYAHGFDGFPHTLFTYGLVSGVGTGGTMPCDTNGDGLASMSELLTFISGFEDPYLPGCIQHSQIYPAGSDYPLFRRDE